MGRFLFVTFPQSGHVNPGLPVARELVSRGHEVCWYTSPRFEARIAATGARFVPYRAIDDVDIEDPKTWVERYPGADELRGLAELKFAMKEIIVGSLVEKCGELERILEDFDADLVLGDTAALPAALLAERRRLPYVLLNVTVLMFPSRDAPPFGTGLTPSATPLGRLRNRVLHWLVTQFVFRDANAELQKVRVELGLPRNAFGFFDSTAHQCDLYLEPTVESFEYPLTDLPDKVRFIGALLPDAPADYVEPPWWGDLASGRPVVLVTQGTLAKDPSGLINPTLEALAGEDVLVVAAAGGYEARARVIDPAPENARVESFIPFARLMPHVSAMVTNAGFGGTHFALSHGVPLVAAGRSEDKSEVSMRIARAGVGIDLRTDTPKPDKIRAAVRRVLDEPAFRERARALQAELSTHDGPAEAADLIERLAASGAQPRAAG